MVSNFSKMQFVFSYEFFNYLYPFHALFNYLCSFHALFNYLCSFHALFNYNYLCSFHAFFNYLHSFMHSSTIFTHSCILQLSMLLSCILQLSSLIHAFFNYLCSFHAFFNYLYSFHAFFNYLHSFHASSIYAIFIHSSTVCILQLFCTPFIHSSTALHIFKPFIYFQADLSYSCAFSKYAVLCDIFFQDFNDRFINFPEIDLFLEILSSSTARL